MDNLVQLDAFQTILMACVVLIIGTYLTKYISFLRNNYIPEAVSGGFIVALILFSLSKLIGINVEFDSSIRNVLMIVFFTTIGLGADFSRIKEGGKPLFIFIIIISLLIVVQNIVGVGLAVIMGENPYYGLLAGSITLSGGHGNGAAWGATLRDEYGISNAIEIAMACATFGLVLGGVIGGPVARHLLKNMNCKKTEESYKPVENFEEPDYNRQISVNSVLQIVGMLSISITIGFFIDVLTKGTVIQMPTFVWCLLVGILLRNFMSYVLQIDPHNETIDVLGGASLTLFLAMALMSLKISELFSLGLPIFIIILVQTIVMIFFAIFITYRTMGKDYDAVVLTAGHCGFGLGATPTAIANMQSVTKSFGPSHKAFLIVPMVAGFIIDISNGIIIKASISFVSKFLM